MAAQMASSLKAKTLDLQGLAKDAANRGRDFADQNNLPTSADAAKSQAAAVGQQHGDAATQTAQQKVWGN